MGAQQTKDRGIAAGSLTVRSTRNKPRIAKDGRQQGLNVFTEHSEIEDVTENRMLKSLRMLRKGQNQNI
ncbi:hypothetical protein GE061_004903 [Apolygus lucorum]|uniref:Uncharacterized protein n=1 Tax=Apolygus lucorum TaxID=248454 RepID=A0A8S9WU58_APOLU|nr:hypothetical protein GE061_004903 [Apolygus lucorum]